MHYVPSVSILIQSVDRMQRGKVEVASGATTCVSILIQSVDRMQQAFPRTIRPTFRVSILIQSVDQMQPKFFSRAQHG